MVISGTNGGSYCHDFGDVVLSDVTDYLTVQYTVTFPGGTDEFVEHYSHDSKNEVHISNLGDLAFNYFPNFDFDFNNAKSSNYAVLIQASIRNDMGTELGSFCQSFYYASCRTNLDRAYTYMGFLTRYYRRKIREQQAAFVAFFNRNQTLYAGVSYKINGDDFWKEFPITFSAAAEWMFTINLDAAKIAELLNAAASTTVAVKDINYFIVYLKYKGAVADAIQFDVDHRKHPSEKNFIFYNAFGVPETLCFRGSDSRTAELEAQFATMKKKYRKLNSNINVVHDVNSGYITQIDRDNAEDLANSSYVWLYDNHTLLDEITITEIEFEDKLPRTAPINVRLKYRIAETCQRKIERNMNIDYRIFDHTFGDTFE